MNHTQSIANPTSLDREQRRRPTPLEKQMRSFLDRCAALPDYRAEPWVIEKADINLLCRYSQRLMSDVAFKLTLSNEQDEALHTLTHGLDHAFIRIRPEHENEGLAWLWSQWKAEWLGTQELRIMKRFSHFTFAGVSTERAGAARWHSAPTYRVHGDAGTFTYEAWSWQSGRKPRLI